MSRVTFERVRQARQVVRWAEAMPLGLEFRSKTSGEIVERVRTVAGWPKLQGRCRPEVRDSSRRMQSRAPAAIDVWLGQAQSRS